ncbi:MAG: 16S rRNA processing protein RimM [Clostridia bacterium]|nr:16S rRNA processing protein RimM [Clostridia bacterium]
MEKSLTVGEIVKPQGIRGEVKVRPFTDTAEDFRQFKRVYLDGEEHKVLSVRIGEGAVYLGLRGVPDRNAAELLRGKAVVVMREDVPEPPHGTYYIVDLLGSDIVTETGEVLGTLVDVRQAATDIYTVKMGEKEVLFPVAKGVVTAVSVEEKKITVDKKRFLEVAVL